MVDDHQIVIDGLKLLLENNKQVNIVAAATSGKAIIEQLDNNLPDVLITDIVMPDMEGLDLCVEIKRIGPSVKILALSMNEEGSMIYKMIEFAGIDGYINKASGKQELLNAIESIVNEKKYFSAPVLEQYELYKKIKTANHEINLTNRELQIIDCIILHLSNKEIAQKLGISERTVETHRKNIFRKTNTKGVASLVQFVKEHGIKN